MVFSPRSRRGLNRIVIVLGGLALFSLALAAYTNKLTVESGTPTDSASVSADGSRLAYRKTLSSGNTEIEVWDRTNGWTHVMSTGLVKVGRPRISRDGKYVVFYGQSPSVSILQPYLVYIDSATAPTPILVSKYKGGETPPAVSNDLGEGYPRVSWWEPEDLPTQIGQPTYHFTLRAADVGTGFVAQNPCSTISLSSPCSWDTVAIPITQVSGWHFMDGTDPTITADGNHVFFVGDNGQIRVTDKLSGSGWPGWLVSGEIVSSNSSGVQANSDCKTPSTSANGQFVAFTSNASNLASIDPGGNYDVFVRDRTALTTTRAYTTNTQSMAVAGADALSPEIAPSGTFVAFFSASPYLVSTPFCSSGGGGMIMSGGGGTLVIPNVPYVADWSTPTLEAASLKPGTSPACLGEGLYPSISNNADKLGFHSSTPGIVTGDNDSVTNVLFMYGHV